MHVRYTEAPNFRYDTVDASSPEEIPALIRLLQLLGILEHRDVALRAVSTACKLCTRLCSAGARMERIPNAGGLRRRRGVPTTSCCTDTRVARRGEHRPSDPDENAAISGSSFAIGDPGSTQLKLPRPRSSTRSPNPAWGYSYHAVKVHGEWRTNLDAPNLLTLSKRFVERSSASRFARPKGAT